MSELLSSKRRFLGVYKLPDRDIEVSSDTPVDDLLMVIEGLVKYQNFVREQVKDLSTGNTGWRFWW